MNLLDLAKSFVTRPLPQSAVPANNGMVSVGKSPFGKTLVSLQHFIESPTASAPLPVFHIQQPERQITLPQFAIKALMPYQKPITQIQKIAPAVVNTVGNFPAQVANTTIGGAADTGFDIGKLFANAMKGKTPKYTDYKGGLLPLAYNIASKTGGIDKKTSAMLKIKNTPQEMIGNFAKAVEPYTFAINGGKAFDLAKRIGATPEGASKLEAVGRKAFSAALQSIPYGASSGLDKARAEKTLVEQFKKAGITTLQTMGAAALLAGGYEALKGKPVGLSIEDVSGLTKKQQDDFQKQGLGLLNDLNEAQRTGDKALMRKTIDQIVRAPDGSPYAPYRQSLYPVFRKLRAFEQPPEEQVVTAMKGDVAMQLNHYAQDPANGLPPNIGDLIQKVDMANVKTAKDLTPFLLRELPDNVKANPLVVSTLNNWQKSADQTMARQLDQQIQKTLSENMYKPVTTPEVTKQIDSLVNAPTQLTEIPKFVTALEQNDVPNAIRYAEQMRGKPEYGGFQASIDFLVRNAQESGPVNRSLTGVGARSFENANPQSTLQKVGDYFANESQNIGLRTKEISKQQHVNLVDIEDAYKAGKISLDEAQAILADQTGSAVKAGAAVNPSEVRSILTDEGNVKERGFITSVKESANTPQGVKDLINGTYVVKSQAKLKADALKLLQADPVAAEQLAMNPTSDVHVQLGNELINYYATKGDFQKAQALTEGMANSGTDLGRAVQAFSNYDKTTPSGAIRFAQNAISAYNKIHKNTPLALGEDDVQALFDKATAIQAMPEGRARNIAANELMDQVNNMIPSSVVDKAITIWKAGLLTSLRTHERNLIGNSLHEGAEITKDIPASLADRLMATKTGERSMTFTTQGLGEGGAKGLQSAKDIIQTGYDPENAISKYDVHHVTWGNNPFEQAMKKYTDTVFRTLGAADKPFWNSAYARSLYDQAGAEALNAGKQGDAAFIQGLVDDPSETMMRNALKDANVASFHDVTKLSQVANSFKQIASRNEITKLGSEIIAPFTGVPSSVAGQFVAYSPVGLLNGIRHAGTVMAGQMPELQRQAAQEVGRGVIGTGLIGIGSYLMSRGLMTGQPKDIKESQQWQLEGKQANSVLIGGKWRGIGSIGPENLLLLAGAKYQEEMQKGPDASLGNFAANVGKDFLAQTFLQGVQQPLAAINDPARYGPSYFGNQLASIVPNIVKDTSKALDTFQRENNTTSDYLKNSIPGLRNQSLPKRDNLGNPIPQEPTGINAYIDLFNSKTPISNIVVDELQRLNAAGFNATPSKLTKDQTINGTKTTLTPKQLDVLESQAGTQSQQALEQLFQIPDYQSLSDEDKARAVDSVISTVRKRVRGTIDVNGLPDDGYVHSSDAPKNMLDTVLVYGTGIFKDPNTVFNAVVSGNPIRKITGDAVVLERKNSLGNLDNGDQSTQVDHKIALSLGGTNDKDNLQILPKNENAAKGLVEDYLITQLKSGKITKAEAQRRDIAWKQEIVNLSPTARARAETLLKGAAFTIIDPETGSTKKIDLSEEIAAPELTGEPLLDKKLLASYNSKLTTRASDIVKLYKDGKLSSTDAETMLAGLAKSKLSGGGKGRKPKKFTIAKIRSSKPPKITLRGVGSNISLSKLAKIPKPPKNTGSLFKVRDLTKIAGTTVRKNTALPKISSSLFTIKRA